MKKRIITVYLAASLSILIHIFFSCTSKYPELNYPSDIENKKSNRPSVSIFDDNFQIRINWESHKDASSYELFRDVSHDGTFAEKIYSGSGLSYVDRLISDNKFYFYRIKALGDIVDYGISDASTGLYSSTALLVDNIDAGRAIMMTKDTEDPLSAPVFTFYDNVEVKRTVMSYYTFEHDENDLVLYADFTGNTKIKNTIIYIQFVINNFISIRYPLMMGTKTKIAVPKSDDRIYIRITSDTVESLPTEDTGSLKISLKYESMTKKEVIAAPLEDRISLTWESNANEERYEIYKKINSRDFIKINTVTTAGYSDTDVTAGNGYQYYVITYYDDGYVEASGFSDVVYLATGEYIIDDSLKASILSYSDKISLTWNSVPGITGYAVYRYLSKIDSNPVRMTAANANFNDTAIQPGIPYFYKVSCIVNGREYMKNSYFAFGIYYPNIDYFEPENDDISNMVEEGSTGFNNAAPPVIYSVTDGLGNTLKDRDFYKYRGAAQNISAYITLPADTQFNDDELTFRWYYEGNYFDANPVKKGVTNQFVFNFGSLGVTGEVDLYCEVIINSSPGGGNRIGSYDMDISLEF